VFITNEVENELSERLKEIVKKHQGSLVENEDDATHIIYKIPSTAAEEEGSEYLPLVFGHIIPKITVRTVYDALYICRGLPQTRVET